VKWIQHILEVLNIMKAKLEVLREKFLPKGMDGMVTPEAKAENFRRP
jgi:hypothetical protein